MSRSQLNINIDPVLLEALRRRARIDGKTITCFICDVLSGELDNERSIPLSEKVNNLEEKINCLENKIDALTTNNHKSTQYSEKEAMNYSQLVKSIFYKNIKQIKAESRTEAFNELLSHFSCFDQWNEIYSLRLKEVLFIEDCEPLKSSELSQLSKSIKCPSPLRTGLINWIHGNERGRCSCENDKFPSQKEICNIGANLTESFF